MRVRVEHPRARCAARVVLIGASELGRENGGEAAQLGVGVAAILVLRRLAIAIAPLLLLLRRIVCARVWVLVQVGGGGGNTQGPA